MTDPFEEIIQQLGESLGIALHVDKNRACVLKAHETLSIQIQTDSTQEKILLGCFVMELPPGRFRENVLAEALKANHLPDPRTAIFGYLAAGNRLTMHQRYPLSLLDGKKLAVLPANFMDYAEMWQEALKNGQPSPAPIAATVKPTNPFGLR
jgi:hypothetical protein